MKKNIKKEKRRIRNSIIIMSFLLSLILLTISVSALKITPAVKNFNLKTMNFHEEYSINILETKGKVSYELKSDNKELLKFVSLKKEGDQIIVDINKPNIELSEGNNLVEILVKESGNDKKNERMFSGNIILKSKLNFLKPIEGAFLESNFVIQSNDFYDPIIFTISLFNKGSVKTNAFGSVIIENVNESNINVHEEVPLSEVSLDIGQRGKIAKTWNNDLKRGSYDSKATLVYGGKTKEFEKGFNIGKPTVIFKKVWLDEYDENSNGISRIKAEVQLDWNIDKEVILEIQKIPSKTKKLLAYEKSDYDLFVENINGKDNSKILLEAKTSSGKVLGKKEFSREELIKDYNKRFYWKVGIIISIITASLIMIIGFLMKIRKRK